jgi:hypothetical protein
VRSVLKWRSEAGAPISILLGTGQALAVCA